MDNFHNMEQGTQAWFDVRLGKVTASKINVLLVKGKKEKWGAGAITYQSDLIAETLTGEVPQSFSSAAMEWGSVTEPQARAMYAFMQDAKIQTIGFADHPTIKGTGASPDGLVNSDGLIEIKCPNTATHIKTLLASSAPKEYINQMQWQMACTGRQWCDFVSFDPRMAGLELFVDRIERDEVLIEKLESLASEFITDTNKITDRLNGIRNQEAA